MVMERINVKWDISISILLLMLVKPKKIEIDSFNRFIFMMGLELIEISRILDWRREFHF
jgi:hypothetical protein